MYVRYCNLCLLNLHALRRENWGEKGKGVVNALAVYQQIVRIVQAAWCLYHHMVCCNCSKDSSVTAYAIYKCDWIYENWSYRPWQEVHISRKYKDTSIHFQVSLPNWVSLEWSASAGCFFPTIWQLVRAVLVHHGALVSRWRTVCGCKAPWRSIKTSCVSLLTF